MTDTPDPVLSPSLLEENRKRFISLFYPAVPEPLQTKTNLYLHILKVRNGDFDLPGLYRELKNNSPAYVLSRLNYQKALNDPSKMMEIASKVQSQFRQPDKNAGEGGELILYSLLEGHLGAPKALSKMEIKTSSGHYVHGSDGVHLLSMEDGSYQLIFGESKMYGDGKRRGTSAKNGITAAFNSIEQVHKSGFSFDTWLVESELLKEEQSDAEKLEALTAIILPSSGAANVNTQNAFGVFIGYEIDVSDMRPEDMELDEIETELRLRAKTAMEEQYDYIKEQITNRGLGIYPIHIYAIPFLKRGTGDGAPGIEKVRIDLAAQLSNRGISNE
ncbi:DUF1837 domain-containing protein [Corynebacterium variabile]|uniref:HamA C-terminal domain-containing protein n=1 Tax=Corynebacterium variabile TaxID=1727 RepID=UPI003A90CB79